MKKLKNYYMHFKNHHHHHQSPERKWIFPLAIGSILSLFLLFIATLTSPQGTHILPFYRSISASYSVFVENKIKPLPVSTLPPPPRLAYLISGSAGDGGSVKRVLLAMYHPHNRYVVHLDLESSAKERADLFEFVMNHELFKRFENVKMITKAFIWRNAINTLFLTLLTPHLLLDEIYVELTTLCGIHFQSEGSTCVSPNNKVVLENVRRACP